MARLLGSVPLGARASGGLTRAADTDIGVACKMSSARARSGSARPFSSLLRIDPKSLLPIPPKTIPSRLPTLPPRSGLRRGKRFKVAVILFYRGRENSPRSRRLGSRSWR